MSAAWVQYGFGVGGFISVLVSAYSHVARRRTPRIQNPAIVKATWRLFCADLYLRLECCFLKRNPAQIDLAARSREKFEQQLGLAEAVTDPQSVAHDAPTSSSARTEG